MLCSNTHSVCVDVYNLTWWCQEKRFQLFSVFLNLNFTFFFFFQVMLYVDGMNGVMKHGPTVQWLYTLIASKYRLVVKTALKLLLVFVEYCEGNCYLLVNAIRTVDTARGSLPWTNIMKWVVNWSLLYFCAASCSCTHFDHPLNCWLLIVLT